MREITRLVFGFCIALLASACNHTASSPTTPTQTQTAAQTTSSAGPTVLAGSFTVAGVVSDGAHPIEGANISAWIDQGTLGYSYMWAHGPLLTDAVGRFQLTGLPSQVKVWLQAWKVGYVQQCAAPEVMLMGDAMVDVQLVSKANLSASAVPTRPGFRNISGVILGNAGDGKQPVAGAFVDFEPIEDFPAALTISDDAGRYMLCGVPEGRTVDIRAGQSGHVGRVSVPPGSSTAVDITLP